MAKDPFTELIAAFDNVEFIADIHLLLNLDSAELPTERLQTMPTLLVPICIDEIFKEQSPENDQLLFELLGWSRSDLRNVEATRLQEVVSLLRSRYSTLRRWEQIRQLPDESDPQVAALVDAALNFRNLPSAASPQSASRLRQYTTTVLSFSKRTGKALLARGRNLVQTLRSQIAELEAPAKADALIEKKAALGARLAPFKGGKTVKWFVVLATAAASLNFPPAGIASLVLVFADP